MLALLAIAFGKDMATATVISLEPVLDALPPPAAPPSTANATRRTSAGKTSGGEGGGAAEEISPGGGGGGDGEGAGLRGTAPIHAKSADGAVSVAKPNPDGDAGKKVGGDEAGCYDFCFFGGSGGGGGVGERRRKRRRYSSVVVPVDFTKDVEAEERQETVKTAARLGCAVGNLTKRQRAMLVAKVRLNNI